MCGGRAPRGGGIQEFMGPGVRRGGGGGGVVPGKVGWGGVRDEWGGTRPA